jgi:hypothetical protein
MHRLQHKLIALVFLLIVAVPVLLSVKFILEENLIQEEVEEKMNTAVLKSISIPKADIIWIKAGKEILLDDKLFDVKNFTVKKDTITLTGYFDDKETELLAKFKKYTETNDRDNPLSKLAFKFLFCPVYNNYAEIVYETSWHFISNKYHSFEEMLPAAPSRSFTHPPQSLIPYFI